MPKRPINLQPPDNSCRRIRRDLDFLRDYWNRLLSPNQGCDIRLPELLRANHLMRHLSAQPSNHGMRVNVSFTILNASDPLESEEEYNETYPIGFRQSPCAANATRCNNFLGNYTNQLGENYAAIERELIRIRLLASLIERDRLARYQNTLYNQRFNDLLKNAEQHWSQKRFPQDSPQTSCSWATARKLQSDNNSPILSPTSGGLNIIQAPQNRAETTLDRNDEATVKQRRSKESMEACQGVSKIVHDSTKISHSVDSPDVKLADGGGVINKSDKRSAQPISCQLKENFLQFAKPSNIVTDQSRRVEDQEHSIKRKLNLEDQAIEIDQGTSSQQDGSKTSDGLKPHIKDVPTIFSLDEKAAARSRIRNGRIPMEGRPYSRRRASSSKHTSFLRMLRKEADQRFRADSSSQRRRGLAAESGYGNRAIHDDPQIERRTPTLRSTVHTAYNPVMHSSATDPILDSNGLAIQLLRLAVLLYVPALMPALNSLIAQQSQQTPVSSAFDGSNDLLAQIFRLLNEQQSIPNLPFVSIESERVSPAVEIDAGSSRIRSEENIENSSIAKKEKSDASQQESISAGTSGWESNNRAQQQNGKNRNWRLASTLTGSDVRLDRNIFTAEDFRMFEEFLRAVKQRPQDARSLSTRSKNEVVMKEYFRNWLHRLLQQLNAASSNLPSNEEAGYPEGSSKVKGKSTAEQVEAQENASRSTSNDSSDSSKNDRNTFAEHEEKDSDSLTSATTSLQSLLLDQDDAMIVKQEEPRKENFDSELM